MKKYFCLFMVTMLTMALTACGEKTTENTPSEKPVEYTGEGEVQGGIPTDEELAEREEEAKTYEEASEEPTVDYSDANVEMETTPTASDTYISADNFWQGEDYFDLEEYLWMNGADEVNAVDMHSDPASGSDITGYYAYIHNYDWGVHINHETCSLTRISDYKFFGNSFDANETDLVTINSAGTQATRTCLNYFIEVIKCVKENPEKENPLADSGLEYN